MATDSQTVTSNRRRNSGASPYNALEFLIDNALKQKINVAIPVRVDSCTAPGPNGAAGYVSATPLIAQRDADGNTLEQVSIPQLPFFRLSCGAAAIVADPQPGDVGLAVFAQSDISGLSAGSADPVAPASFRSFDMSDGIYLGGILGQPPTVFIHLDPEHGEITLTCRRSLSTANRWQSTRPIPWRSIRRWSLCPAASCRPANRAPAAARSSMAALPTRAVKSPPTA